MVSVDEQDKVVSANDVEMDARAKEAVKSAIEKAKFCKKPVAYYDPVTKRAYVEYPNRERKYVE